MTKAIHYNTLERGCAQLGLDLPRPQAEKLLAHLELLREWNRTINLTAVRDLDAMVARHALDSLSIARFVRGDALLDIGSGAGFPGLPLAVANPQLQVTVLDSRAKRVEFLRAVCAALALDNVEVIRARVEDWDCRPARKFDTLATRAFAPLARTLELTAALQQTGARLLAMKGRSPAGEIAEIDANAKIRSRIKTIAVEKLTVPFLRAERHLVIAEFSPPPPTS